VELFATLLTDFPLDAARFRGVLLDVARSSLAGAVTPRGLEARHSYGDAAVDADVRDVLVRVRRGGTAHPAALAELRKHGFTPVHALEFLCNPDPSTQADTWALLRLYSDELKGWVITEYLAPEEVIERAGTADGVLHAPLGAKKRRAALISSVALARVTP
jgi:hypothetical protein